MTQDIPQRVNGIPQINGDNTVPRHGATVHVPGTITNSPAITHNGVLETTNSAADLAQIPRVVEPNMHQSTMMPAASLTNNTSLQPEAPLPRELAGPPPVVVSRQEWTNRRTSRAALVNDWRPVSSPNGVTSHQDRTTLSSWHNTQPSDEPWHHINEFDHLGPPQETSHPNADGSPRSDIGAVAGSSPRSPEQDD
ncbi:hypothetical protein PG994_013508 [Apiospora phragmitis]|uniref:Uncharacterized protein n=1 Tax=Apiospora phragmitis TaxID=2905665 RepID=A0ABR1TAM5_9PEZI